MTIYIPALVAVIGLIIYFASSNGKVVEVGRIMFAFGLLVFLIQVGNNQISLGK